MRIYSDEGANKGITMDKQTPTLVIKHDDDGLIYGRCPRCGKMMDHQRYCGNCGQAVIHVSKYGQRIDQDFGKPEYVELH